MTYDELKKLEAAFEAALRRIESGETTVEDARIVRAYIKASRALIRKRLQAEEAAGRTAA